MESTTNPATGWLLFLYSLPASKASGRVSLWRRIKKYGALQLKTSAYVLPNEPAHFEHFQWLAQQVQDDGGEATLARVSSIENVAREDLIQLFDDMRSADYEILSESLQQFIQAHRKKLGKDFAERLEKLRRQFSEIRALDFFNSKAGTQAGLLLERAERLGEPRSKKPPILDAKLYEKRTWLTRPHPEIDRVGSAWLIKNFIDPKARFVFGENPANFPEAIPYDMMNVEFTHYEEDCTFETLVKRFGLSDSGVHRIAEMIHDADLEDGKFQRPEAVGLHLVFKGWIRLGLGDDEILEKGFACLDALHAEVAGSAGKRR